MPELEPLNTDARNKAPFSRSRRAVLCTGLAAATGLASSSSASAQPAELPRWHGGAPPLPTPDELAIAQRQWIDAVQKDQALTKFKLYPQPSRSVGGDVPEGSYQIYLPPGYEMPSARRYPVIFWLHGGFGNARDGAPAVERINRAILAGKMPATIVVVPQGLPSGWYVDSKDGARPVEQVIAYDLVSHVDATYRTIAGRDGRTVEGMSMGGYGALRLGLKHPDVFGRISAVAPSILKSMADEPVQRTGDTFFGDQNYYDAVGPWTLLLGNAPKVRRLSRIRVLAGGADERLLATLREFHTAMSALNIKHEYAEVAGAGHDYQAIVDGVGDRYFEFWRA